jgi:uncharacterized repeat protein (TIGR01451 family)
LEQSELERKEREMRNSLAYGLRSLVLALLVIPGLPFVKASPPPVQAIPAEALSASGWEDVTPDTSTATMYTLDMLSATEGWAGGMAGFILKYNGSEWGGVPTTFDKPILGMDMVNSNLGWGVGWGGIIVKYDGSSWQVVPGTPDVASLADVFMLSASDGWAVGSGGTILRYAGGTWQPVSSPVTTQLKGIDILNAGDGWAVGVSGVILHWNGGAWSGGTVVPGGSGLYAVDAAGAADVWAVGGAGLIYHYTGGGWSSVPSPTTETLYAVEMVDSQNGWAVGANGTIIRYKNGTWQLASSPVTDDLYALDMVSATDGWAMGKGGKILHYSPKPADLSTSTKTVDKTHAAAGDELQYTIRVKNSGDLDALAVVVTDMLDLGLVSYVSSSTSKGSILGPNPLVVTIGNMAPAEEVVITFQVNVIDQGLECWFVPNQAQIAMTGAQWNREAITTVGDCHSVYVPVVFRKYP